MDRAEMLEAIAEKADEEREDEFEGEETDESPEEETEEEEPESEEEPSEEEESEEEPEQMITVVVDGVESQVPLSKLIDAGKRTYQKETAADKRLFEANKLLEEAKRSQLSHDAAPEQPSEENLAKERYDRAKKKYAQAVVGVDEDDIYSAQDELFEAQQQLWNARNKGPDLDAIKREAIEAMTQQNLLERLRLAPEQGGQADIFNDDRARAIARIEADKLIADGADPLAWTTYEKAGVATRRFLGWDSGFEEKRNKKKQMASIKTAHGKPPSKKGQEKELSREEVIREGMGEILKARGQ